MQFRLPLSRRPRGFKCAGCNDWHRELPMSFHALAPAEWSDDLLGAEDCELAEDACIIRHELFFIRGLIQIPIIDHDEHFEWGVWASLSEDDFWQTMDKWETVGREATPPLFGRLSTELPAFGEPTTSLALQVHTRPVGLRPLFELEPSDHLLALEQREGMSWTDLTTRVERLLQD